MITNEQSTGQLDEQQRELLEAILDSDELLLWSGNSNSSLDKWLYAVTNRRALSIKPPGADKFTNRRSNKTLHYYSFAPRLLLKPDIVRKKSGGGHIYFVAATENMRRAYSDEIMQLENNKHPLGFENLSDLKEPLDAVLQLQKLYIDGEIPEISAAQSSLPPEISQAPAAIADSLKPDEQLLWLGQPSAAEFKKIGLGYMGFGALMFTIALAILITINHKSDGPEWFATIILGIFVLISIAMMACFFTLPTLARRTNYAITNRRLIISRPKSKNRTQVISFTAEEMGPLDIRLKTPIASSVFVGYTANTSNGDHPKLDIIRDYGVKFVHDIDTAIKLLRNIAEGSSRH